MVFERAIPILRSFSEEKAKEFYVGFLRLAVDWEHRFEPDTPLYMQVSRGRVLHGGVVLHLSEHHGDGTPGSGVYVTMTGIAEFHREVTSRPYRNYRPGLEEAPWGATIMKVIDPFGTRITFAEAHSPTAEPTP